MTASADNRLNVGEQRHDSLCPAMEEIRGYAYVEPGFIRNCQCELISRAGEKGYDAARQTLEIILLNRVVDLCADGKDDYSSILAQGIFIALADISGE